MSLDLHLVISIVCIFSRCTAMLLTAPISSNMVPVNIRILTSLIISLSLVTVLQSHIPPVPDSWLGLLMLLGKDVMVGILIGGFLQLLMYAVQMAGSFMDVQIGTGSAQIFNPLFGGSASPISQLHGMLATVLILLLNGHRMMISAFVKSYSMPGPTFGSVQSEFLPFLAQMGMITLQIAAPIAAVTIVIDASAGIINKAVPQTQPFLISLPAKLAIGMVVLAIGLPSLVTTVQGGLDIAFDHLGQMLRGG